MKDALKRVPGVADVIIFGERKFSMRLWLDPARLAARQLTAGDVVNALREQNVQVAAGSVGDAPAREGQTYQISVRAAGRLQEAREFENIIVEAGDGRARSSGCATSARAELGAETYSSTLRFQGVRRGRLRRHAAAERQRARRASAASSAELERLTTQLSARACSTRSPSTRPSVVRGVDRGSAEDAARGDRRWSSS